jgi:hypothetical protein
MTLEKSKLRATKHSLTMPFYLSLSKHPSSDTWSLHMVLWEPLLAGSLTCSETECCSLLSLKSLTSLASLSIGDQPLVRWRAGPPDKLSTQWTSPRILASPFIFHLDLTFKLSTTYSQESLTITTRLFPQRSKKSAKSMMLNTGLSHRYASLSQSCTML